jgi:hypothetical protein
VDAELPAAAQAVAEANAIGAQIRTAPTHNPHARVPPW